MKTFKVLGSGCSKCQNTEKKLKQIAEKAGIEIVVEKIQSPEQIMAYGVMSTPAVVMNEQVIHQGSIPSTENVESWLCS